MPEETSFGVISATEFWTYDVQLLFTLDITTIEPFITALRYGQYT
jgi:hypothetical protein